MNNFIPHLSTHVFTYSCSKLVEGATGFLLTVKPLIILRLDCWSIRCSWSIACRRCSNYIFILDLTPGSTKLCKYYCNTRRETFKFWDLMRLILEIWRYPELGYALKSLTINSRRISVSEVNNIAFPLSYNLRNSVNTLRPRQSGRRFADATFKRIFLVENVIISMNLISLNCVPKVSD